MESPLPTNPYKTLNVAKDATLATIRSAHRKLVLTCHPDKIKDKDDAVKVQKAEQFHQVQQAYEILSDDAKRRQYDEQVKLAELRAEILAEKGGSRGIPDLSSRAGTSPIVEVRDGRRYEERVPSRVAEEDFFAAKFQEHRSTSKQYDDYYPPASPRRSSGRMPDERRKGRDLDDERDHGRHYRQVMKEAEKKANHGHQKKKDKDKRKDREAKFSTRRASYVEDEDSDSDITERYYPSRHEPATKHPHEEFRRRDRDEIPRRNSKRDDSDRRHDTEAKGHEAMGYESKANVALNYIQMSREGGGTIEIEPRRPSTGGRQFSFFEARPSLPHNSSSVENIRRASRARDSRRNSPVRKDRVTEIVEPPSSRKFGLPTGSSDPRGLKHAMHSYRKDSLRASTMDTMREEWHAPLPRADTMPSSRRNEHASASSRLRPMETDDSESSDSERYHSKSRRNRASEDEDKSGKRTYFRVKPADDGYRERDRERERDRDRERDRERERDISPRSRRATDRPAASSRPPPHARTPQRSASFAATYSAEHIPSPRPPPLSRAETARPPPSQSRRPLYGEVQFSASPEGHRIVNQQPKYGPDDIRYAPHIIRETSRDAYPYESSRNRPTMSRRETRAVY